MTIAKSVMIDRFLHGIPNEKASREEVESVNNLVSIVGYGWAIYAVKFGHEVLLFGDGYKTKKTNVGWAGYSGQTTQHLQEIKGALEETNKNYTVVDYQLRKSELENFENPHEELSQIVEENEVEARDGTGYTYTLNR